MTTFVTPRSLELELPTGLRAHVLDWGARDDGRPSVLLIHGFLDSAWGFEALVAAGLADRHHVIAPDLRGHGDSEWVGRGGYYHFYDYVADLRHVVSALAGAELAIVGHSMGGSVAAYYAGAFPDGVTHLALLEGVGPPEDDAPLPPRVAHWTEAWPRARTRSARGYASVEAAAERLRRDDPATPADLALRLAERTTRLDPDGQRRFKHDPLHLTRGPYPFREENASQFWRAVRCPVLAVDGSDSPFLHLEPAATRRLSHFASLERVRIDGAGHMLQRHRPEELCRLLLDFLAR